jgi:PAP2 superfamily
LKLFLTVLFFMVAPLTAYAAEQQDVLNTWYKLVLQLVRHTPTYSPPVASRSFAYLGVTAFEANGGGLTFAGQLNDLKSVPQREAGKTYDDATVLHSALSFAAQNFFSNTGPSGQNAIKATARKLLAEVSQNIDPDVLQRSEDYGQAVAAAILEWSKTDGGAVVENLGFPITYQITKAPGHWVPTSKIALQQNPLLPNWGKNRPFAMPRGTVCNLPPPPEYSEDKASQFFKELQEVYDISKALTPEQKAIARFWSDDPMLSPTPPGHWISIAMQLFEKQKTPIADRVDLLARIGIAEADAFIGCWNTKYQYDFLRPVSIIKKVIDAKWESLLITPPFPEYPSGHSTQSGAAAAVLTQYFGENFAFDDATHIRDGIKPRHFASFAAAADEAAVSRLYGGIHFRAAIEKGLEQGRCIGAFTTALKTRK